MKRSFIFALAAIGSIASASASDINFPVKAVPYSAVYDWSGFYAGLNAGYGWSKESMGIGGGNSLGSAIVSTGVVPGQIKTDANGAVLGGQIGYNKQFGMWIVGLEADAEWANLKGSDTRLVTTAPLGLPLSLTTTGSNTLDWYASAVGRVGFTPIDRFMVYGKGGVAFGGITNTANVTLAGPVPLNAAAIGSFGDSHVGWTAGGGVEYAVMHNLIFGVDYSYLNFGDSSANFGATVAKTPVLFTAMHADDFHIVKARLNYKLPY